MHDQTVATICIVLALAGTPLLIAVGIFRDRLRELDRDIAWVRATPRPDGFDRAPRPRAVADPGLRRSNGFVIWTDRGPLW